MKSLVLLPILGVSFVSARKHGSSYLGHSRRAHSAAPVINNASIPAPWGYLGCYANNALAPILNSEVSTDYKMTEKNCVTRCSQLGYTYARVELGVQCRCGYTRSSAVKTYGCNTVCSGASGEFCGGSQSLDVFTNGGASPTVNGWSVAGCYFYDDVVFRTLTDYYTASDTNNTVRNCISICNC
jgi:hypothetical protein